MTDERPVETCGNCGSPVLVMAFKGTGFCGATCTEVDRQYREDQIEHARNEQTGLG